MSKSNKQRRNGQNRTARRKTRQATRQLQVTAIRREAIDYRKWGAALLELAQLQSEDLDDVDAQIEVDRLTAVRRHKSQRTERSQEHDQPGDSS